MAKQNSLNCIREALPNTRTLNFKIHKNLHGVVGYFLTLYPIAMSLMQMKCSFQHFSVQ